MSAANAQTLASSTQSMAWQTRLNSQCRSMGVRPPVYQECSDRRGGRTAWSSTVEVDGRKHRARYWYDGACVNNAREDAAEVALQYLGVVPTPPRPQPHFQGTMT
ncbi:hypothetical protein AAFC00_002607 [Neodothiora populina]|uniref:DRBM domain-containing protein n=1 Tax=Neodothiora populina TaxID=2781224 RepID=A0ABR3P7X9_9PEZI